MKKAKVLISHYSGEKGFYAHRVYTEPHYKQADLDLKMIMDIDPCGKEVELFECEIYEPVEREPNV